MKKESFETSCSPLALASLDKNTSMSAKIYAELKSDILCFKVKPGVALQEMELANRYGASRTPAREAARRLVQEGLAVRDGRMYRVRKFTPADVSELYELREALEKMVVRLAIERATDDDITRLEAHLASQHRVVELRDISAFNRLDTHFHMTLAEMAKNTLLAEQLALVHDKVMLVRELELSRAQGMSNAYGDHHRIVDAISRRNVEVAEAEMRYHIRSVIALYHGYQEPHPISRMGGK